MAELKQDPSQALLSLLYPLLGGEANVASLTRRGNRTHARLTALCLIINVYFDIRVRKNTCTLLWPLHQADGIVGKIIADPHKLQLLGIGKAVQIKVINH